MNNIDKYAYREKKIPYRFEKTIKSNGDISLKEYEFFDGNEVKWCISQDFKSDEPNKLCNSSPLFDNILVDRNEDEERIIYQDDDKIVVRGRFNDNDMLFEIYSGSKDINSWFGKTETFGEENVRITAINSELLRVDYSKHGIEKVIFFDCKNFKPYSNEFDAVYDEQYFLKSYFINKSLDVRVFLGKVDCTTGVVKPIGYDIHEGNFIEFPINEQGLIDDNLMLKEIYNYVCGYYISFYERDVLKYSLESALMDLGIDEEDVDGILIRLDRRNKNKVKQK